MSYAAHKRAMKDVRVKFDRIAKLCGFRLKYRPYWWRRR